MVQVPAVFVTWMVPFGLKMVVPTPVLVSTELSQRDLAVVIVSVSDTVPSLIVTTGATVQDVTVVEAALMPVIFVADPVLKAHIGAPVTVAANVPVT